jgi:ubiquinone/menaquinone biosynthesis C-methylase UbiE
MTAINHHANYPGFAGVTGLLIGLIMNMAGGARARLVADLADLSAADRVVDVGCGPGTAVRAAARRGAQAIGVDPAPVMLWLAQRLTCDRAAVTWTEGTAENLRQPDGSASVMWAVASVHHWRNITMGLAEVRRVLTPGGRFLALERQVRPGATGLASHGWTNQQAQAFAAQCRTAGFGNVRVEKHRAGQRTIYVVRAVQP